jgi:protein AroM
MMVKVGLLTIGQSPREDILLDWKFDQEQIKNHKPMGVLVPPKGSPIPSNVEFIHLGALDEIPKERMSEIQPPKGSGGLISRLRDGSWTLIDNEKIKPIMPVCVEKLEKAGCKAILQLCTSNFTYLKPSVPYLKPGDLCNKMIDSITSPESKIGMLNPSPPKDNNKPKKLENPQRWGLNRTVFTVNANPYELPPESIIPAVKEMKSVDVDMIYMNCLGYSTEHKKIVRNILEKPTILPRSVCAKTLAELFEK